MKSNGRPTNRVVIGPYVYRVKEDAKLLPVAQASGAAVHEAEVILLDPGMSCNMEKETVLHEALHGVWNAALGTVTFSEKDQEKAVRSLAPWLIMFLRDNPELIEWMQEEV